MFGEFEYAAKSWPQAFRVVLKAEVLPGSFGAPDKDNERFVVTSMRGPSPRTLYQQEYCARAGGGRDQASEMRPESRPDFGLVFHRQLWPSAVDGGRLMSCTSNCANWVCKAPRSLPPSPGQSSSRCSKSPCASNSTKTGCCCICPRHARSKRCWRQSASGLPSQQQGARHAGFPMTRHVWLTRRCRPPFFITTSRFTPPVGAGGVSPENQKICIKVEVNALRKVYAIFRLARSSPCAELVLNQVP